MHRMQSQYFLQLHKNALTACLNSDLKTILRKIVMIIDTGTLVNQTCQYLTAWEWLYNQKSLSRIVYFNFNFQR